MQEEADLEGKRWRRVACIVLWRQGGQLAGQGCRMCVRVAVRPLMTQYGSCCGSM